MIRNGKHIIEGDRYETYKCIFMQIYLFILGYFVTLFSITDIEHLWPNLITRPPSLSYNLCCRNAACCLPAASPAISHLNSFKLLHCWLKNDTHIAIYRLMQSISESILTENAKTLRPEIVQNLLTGDTRGTRARPPSPVRRRSWRYSAPPRHDRHQFVRMYRSV